MSHALGVPLSSLIRFEIGSVDMFKKFFSNTLLSVVVDKRARDKMSAVNEHKSTPTPSDDELDISRMSLGSDASPKTAALRSTGQSQPAHGQEDDSKVLTHEALASAEEELKGTQNPNQTVKPNTSERAALIKQAMAIRRSKLYILDELTQDQRNKLTYMAIQALNDQIDK